MIETRIEIESGPKQPRPRSKNEKTGRSSKQTQDPTSTRYERSQRENGKYRKIQRAHVTKQQ